MSDIFSCCTDCLFGPSKSTSYDTVSSSRASEISLTNNVANNSNNNNDNYIPGWVFYINRADIIPIHTKVYAALQNGYLYCYNQEKERSTIGEVKDAIIIMDLAGATCESLRSSLGKSYGITIRGQTMTTELDPDSLVHQKTWLLAIQKEIEEANIAALTDSEDKSNKGAANWYIEKLKQKQIAIDKLRTGTPMTKHYISMGSRKEHERIVEVDEKGNKVIWKASNNNNDKKEVLIDEIIEVVEGSRTAVLSSLSTNPERVACCWSIITDNKTVDFETQAVSEKERWVDNLRIIINLSKLEKTIEKKRKTRRPSHRAKLVT